MKRLRPVNFFPDLEKPMPGLYGYTKEVDGGRVQIHLRWLEDGRGLLLVNASRAYHLNPTATWMAWTILEGRSEREALRRITKAYKVSTRTAREDLLSIQSLIDQITRPEGACPLCDLDLSLQAPFSEIPTAPYRMDLALTYRCNANCAHCYNARPRQYPEIDTQSWQHIIDKLWTLGIPHICFTGGEATLREDLPDLIAHAQAAGHITGLLSNGRKLADPAYLRDLVEAGLDHVQITLESHDPQIHDRMVRAQGAWRETVDGIRNALDQGLYVMTNTTLLTDNAHSIDATLDFLASLGVPTVGCNALIYAGRGEHVSTGIPEEDLVPLLETVRQHTERNGQRLIWYTPTQYCHFDPVMMELGVKACTAAMYNMCVEPDGGVIPCQSYYQQLGNMLTDAWESIWNHETARWLRERQYVPEECQTCAMLKECGGGCPLTLQNQPQQAPLQNAQLREALTGRSR